MAVPEIPDKPNDSDLFNALVGVVDEVAEERGSPFYMLFSPTYNPRQDANYYLNNYPSKPEELYGVPGVMTDMHMVNRELEGKPDLTVVAAGMCALRSDLNSDGRSLTIWSFNTALRGKYKRIGELSMEGFGPDPDRGNDIYVISSNSSVWTKPFWETKFPWRQLIDHELEELVERMRELVI